METSTDSRKPPPTGGDELQIQQQLNPLAGNSWIRGGLPAGQNTAQIAQRWQPDLAGFLETPKK